MTSNGACLLDRGVLFMKRWLTYRFAEDRIACFAPQSSGYCRPLPIELVSTILECAHLSVQDLVRMSQVCRHFRRAIEESPTLLGRLFVRAHPEIVGVNDLLLQPVNHAGRHRFWNGVASLLNAQDSRLMDMLLCQPPATTIDIFFYDRRRRRTGGNIEIRTHSPDGVRVRDVVEALVKEGLKDTLLPPQVSFVEPATLRCLFGAPEPVWSRHVE